MNDKVEQEELMMIYNEVKTSGITSVSTEELEKFTKLFTLSLPRSENSLVRVDEL